MSGRIFITLFLAFFSFSVGWCASPPSVIAHRGGAALGVENTLSCIEAAIVAGADAVEIDVRLTKDGCPVVFHDAKVNATTNGRGKISDLSLEYVQSLQIYDRKGVPTRETIPTLQQVLSFVNGRCGVLIEVKEAGRGIEERILNDVLACNAAEWVSVQSFSDDVLFRFHELNAPFPLEKLIVFKVPWLPLVADGTLRNFSLDKYHFISSFNFKQSFFPSRLAAKLRKAGKQVKVWAVDAPSNSIKFDVDGVITDAPHLWR